MSDVVLHLAPGSGLLSRRPRALLYAAASDATLVDAFTAAADGAELQALASATVAAGFDVGPFVGLSWDGGLRVMAFGDVAVETDQPSLPMLSGAGSRTWVEHTVVADAAVVEVAGANAAASTDLVAGTVLAGGFRLELAAAGAPLPAPPESAPSGTTVDATTSVPRMEHTAVLSDPVPGLEPTAARAGEPDLEHGQQVEPSADVTDVAEVAPATTSPITNPAPEPIDVDDADPAAALAAIQAAAVGPDGQPLDTPGALPAAPPRRAPEPLIDDHHHDPDVTLPPPASEALLADVRGVEHGGDSRGSLVDAKMCAKGHANPPTAATCAVCAEFLAPGATAIVHVPRPSLGRLQLDDGELLDLDQELLIGRNPDRDQDPARTALRRVKTLGDKVSRSHLEVRFQAWDVLVADCGSTNGTFVVPHPGGQVVALEPGRPQMIDAGAVVYFGSRSFTVLGREESL